MKIRSKLLLIVFSLVALAWGQVAVAAPQQQQFVAPHLVVNSSFLNVRSGPGVQYSVLITVVGGTELPVLAQASDNVWFQVSTVIGVGWVNVQYTVPRGSFENVPVVSSSNIAAVVVLPSVPVTLGLPTSLGQGGGGGVPSTSSTTPVTGGRIVIDLGNGKSTVVVLGERYRAVINVEAVNLRTQPSESAPSLGTLYREPTVDYPILGNAADKGFGWIAIEDPVLGVGWIEAPKAIIRLSQASGTVVVIAGNAISMTDSPGGSGQNLPILSEGQEAFLVGISPDSHFVQIQLADGTTGWVPFNAVIVRTGTPTDQVDFTQFPTTISASTSATLGQGGGAIVVVAPPAAYTLDVPHVVINASFLNIRSGPGAQFTIVATLSGGTELAVLGMTPDGVWYLVRGAFGQGWVNSEFTIFRGSIDVVPIIPYDSATGLVSNPVAVISGSVTLYAAPGTNFGVIGTLNGPVEVAVVARTGDAVWVQLNTAMGYGWVLASQIVVRGDVTLIPIVG